MKIREKNNITQSCFFCFVGTSKYCVELDNGEKMYCCEKHKGEHEVINKLTLEPVKEVQP